MVAAILVVNTGSSSHKCKLFAADLLDKDPLWEGSLDCSLDQNHIDMTTKSKQTEAASVLLPADSENPLKLLLESITIPYELVAIGHRVVHGGAVFTAPVRITKDVKAAIRSLIPLAPLHNLANLQGIDAMEILFPDTPQYAVFDTSFHLSIPSYASKYPIPESWSNLGIRRYGFHGISHRYCAHRAAKLLGCPISDLKIISAHLGSGCSVTAVEGGYSKDTSMGFTPLEGVMMGTRSGSIDPGIIFFLQREHSFSAEAIETALNHSSGLKAISRTDGDMRQVLKGLALDDPDCRLAFEIFVYKLSVCMGGMVAALGALDAIIFTAGIGENTPLLREEVCQKLAYLGVKIDAKKNRDGHGDRVISEDNSSVKVLVVHTQEEWAIAKAYNTL